MDTLFHYCSNEAFCSIVTNKSIWLSSLASGNDSAEGRVASETLLKMARDSERLNISHVDALKRELGFLNDVFHGFGFCFSVKDLLSQWRGYASDGAGVSIGFSKEYIEALCEQTDLSPKLQLENVVYKEDQHSELLKEEFSRIESFMENKNFNYRHMQPLLMSSEKSLESHNEDVGKNKNSLMNIVVLMFQKLYLMKKPAFHEEQEVRIISYQIKNSTGWKYRAKDSIIVPYIEIPIINIDDLNPINAVILGPKNQTPVSVVENMLKTSGFDNVKVHVSDASYR